MDTSTKSRHSPDYRTSTAPTYQEVIAGDANPAPDIFKEYSEVAIGEARIPRSRYTSEAFAALELEHMWPKVWQVACREEEIPEAGDCLVYDSPGASILVVRTETMDIKAYYNSCRHRGMKLCFGATSLEKITCPFHSFQWNLDGTINHIPAEWDFQHLESQDTSLVQVKVGVWGGFVFINRDPDSAPLLDYLGHLPDHFREWPRDDVYLSAKIIKRMDANWKTCIEAFVEAYHLSGIHPQALPFGGDSSTQYDVWPDDPNVSRFLEATGVASDQLASPLAEQEILEKALSVMGGPQADIPTLAPGQRARDLMAKAARIGTGQMDGRDYSNLSDTEAVDAMQYSLFPNFVLFRSLGYPYAYRFLPDGRDPNKATFDFLVFSPKPPDGGDIPETQVVELELEDTYRDCGVLPPWLGEIYDQDTVGLANCQKGLANGGDADIVLSNYQEIRIRHLHQTLMSYVSGSN